MFCMVKAFALVTGETEDNVKTMLKSDPCEIVDESRTDSGRYRGVYIEELQELAISMGLRFYWIDPNPKMENGKPMWDENYVTQRWERLLTSFDGILVGAGIDAPNHAVAWMNNRIIDPTGRLKEENFGSFKADYFLAIERGA